MASIDNPKYKVIVKRKNTKETIDLSGALIEVTLIDSEDEFAYRAEIKVANLIKANKYMASRVSIRDVVRIYANIGNGDKLVFVGLIWQKNVLSEKERTFTITAYDNLIYLQKSEGRKMYKKGLRTKTIMKHICKGWKLKMRYSYASIKHGKLKLTGDYASFISDSLLKKVRSRTGVKGIIRSVNGVLEVVPEGHNASYYHLKDNWNIISNEYVSTMDDAVTKVMITGVKTKNGKKAISVKGDVKKWGTIQVVEERGKRKTADVKKTAKQTIKSKGHPHSRRKITARDIPYVRKGDRIMVNNQMNVVKSITHLFHEGTMELETAKQGKVVKSSGKKKKGKKNK